jgi:hypothetical protein
LRGFCRVKEEWLSMLDSCFEPRGRPLECVVNDKRIEKIKINKA